MAGRWNINLADSPIAAASKALWDQLMLVNYWKVLSEVTGQ